MSDSYAEWLKTKPQNVQDFAARYKFKPGDVIEHNGQDFWFFGYNENQNGLISIVLTPVNPMEDYDEAMEQRVILCAGHFQ